MAGVKIAIERKQLLVSWWNSQKSPTFLAAHLATGISDRIIPVVLAEMGVDISGHINNRRSAKFNEHRTMVEELTDVLRPLWDKAYKGAKKNRVFSPPRYPWVEIFADDEHGLFLNPTRINQVVEREGGKNVGFNCFEVLTLDAFSRFRKTYDADPIEEVKSLEVLFRHLDKAFAVKRLGRSNHTQRFVDFVKNMTDNVNAADGASEFWKTYFESVTGYKGKFEMVDTVAFQVGSVLMAHMRAYLASGATTVERVKLHCEAQTQLGFKPPFDVVAMGHTHRLSDNGARGYPCRLWEVGCQCYVPEYALDPEKPMPCTTITIQNGYGRIEWDTNGHIFWPGTRVVNLGIATIPEVSES